MTFINDTVDYLLSKGFKVDKTLTDKSYDNGLVFVVPSDYEKGGPAKQGFQVVVATVEGKDFFSVGQKVWEALRDHPQKICNPVRYETELGGTPIPRDGMPDGDIYRISCISKVRI